MTEPQKYVNLSINVNGTVHKVKVQEGIAFGQGYCYSDNQAWLAKGGSLFRMEEKTETKKKEYDGSTYEAGTGIFTPKTTNEIKMTEAEFALLTNVADNDGDASTLSKADIEKAQKLYSQNNFTKDVTQNLPKGFHGEKENQHLGDSFVSACVTNYNADQAALVSSLNQEYKSEEARLTFVKQIDNDGNFVDQYLEKYSKLSVDGKVKKEYTGPGDGDEWTEYTYTDKNGNVITMSPNLRYDSEKESYVNAMVKKVYTDSDGKRVYEVLESGAELDCELPGDEYAYGYGKIKVSKTSDGKQVYELYNNDYESKKTELSKIIVSYKQDGKDVVENHDKDGNLVSKVADYTTDGKKVHENYNSENKMTKKTVDYTIGEKKVHEDYDGDNKFQGKKITWEQTVNNYGYEASEVYNANNKIVERNLCGLIEVFDDGVLKTRTKDKKETHYENGKVVKVRDYHDYVGSNNYTETYYENGKAKTTNINRGKLHTVVDSKGYKVSFNDFDIKKYSEPARSEDGQKYYEEFKNLSAQEIASKIKSQIDGPSSNADTLAMIEGVPTEKLISVMREYAKTGGIWFGNKASLMTDLTNEWGMEKDALVEVARKAFASHLLITKEKDLTEKDVDTAEKVKAGCDDEKKLKEYLLDIEKKVTE